MESILGYKSLLSPQPCPWNIEATLPQKKEIATQHISLISSLDLNRDSRTPFNASSAKMGKYDEANEIEFNCVIKGGKCRFPI